ncbi:MAG: EFR1 family ferrodoxin [Clostridiales bacterium]|nr:EFR1 family ferrodoxin [Clostridiales bacterium]
MIFYFTGTGNSLAAATFLKDKLQDRMVNMGEVCREKKYSYELCAGEKLGFVFPCYFCGIPSIVSQFIKKMSLGGVKPIYVYAVVTYGGSAGGTAEVLQAALKKRNMSLDAYYTVKMPRNFVLMYNPPSETSIQKTLEQAEIQPGEIAAKIRHSVKEGTSVSRIHKKFTSIMYPRYRHGRETGEFWTDEQCVGCGACAARCPSQAIEMQEGRPVWVKECCAYCTSCINRCGAIQFGEKTEKRRRYVHPILRKNKEKHA